MPAIDARDPGNTRTGGSLVSSAAAGSQSASAEESGMSWEAFYLGCFLVGFFFSLLSFLAGSTHLHLHLPRGFHGHVARGPGGKGSQTSPINFGTIAAFLAWFGGAGFLLARFSSVWYLIALGLAALAGVAGAAVVFWFLFKVLLKHERDLDP